MSEPNNPSVKEVIVAEHDAGQRIDNYLLRELKGVPKSRIYRILRKGEVRVNRGRIKPEYRLRAGDTVRIPPVRVSEEREGPTPQRKLLDQLEGAILYEDARLLVLNKPSGLAVHGGSGLSYGAIEALRAMRPREPFLELVHRLDRDTSGCLLIAKRRSTLRALHELLRGEGMNKHYLALLMGGWRGGKVNAPLRKNVLRSGERVVRVGDDGKPALTLFKPIARYRVATLMDVTLVTGRTHQVRVHSQHAGHPIAGDDKYGDPEFNRQMAELGLRRLFLHASRLSFRLPDSDRVYEFEAPLDDVLTGVLERLERDR